MTSHERASFEVARCVIATFAAMVLVSCEVAAGVTEPAGTTTGEPALETSTGDAASTSAASGSGETAGTSETGDDSQGPKLDVGQDFDVGHVPDNPCEGDVGDYIYLVDVEGGLHRIAPNTLVVEHLGTPKCPDVLASSSSLTLDRFGKLWAFMRPLPGTVFQQGLFTIDPLTLDCESTAFVDDPDDTTYPHSLAFVVDAPAETETLYAGVMEGTIDPTNPMRLARIDADSLALDVFATLPVVTGGGTQAAQLTGTGDGRLFGVFRESTAVVAQIDRADGNVLTSVSVNVPVEGYVAFAQWEGRLWLFSSEGDSVTTAITAWNPAGGAIEEISPGVDAANIVGAAVSTCAPFTPAG